MTPVVCVRCGAERRGHADIDPVDAPAGICPRFDPLAPGWMLVATRLLGNIGRR